eukprot:CAMPEP_0113584956 /NCGR_PEP_ID=MMETSP0015_2-20120614/33397_1 /TAXON_ID=2838 /ORGANISM="Odontella" /LENGTH=310 /DNA_ID=CAMNT_0000490075 /DNA_START=76 /DNA_END=1005 /DNA_ORIENTATION=+ /assembly_acc=CAM_ASM_000160
MAKTLHRNLEAKLAALEGPEWDSSEDEGDSAPALAAEDLKGGGTKSSKSAPDGRGTLPASDLAGGRKPRARSAGKSTNGDGGGDGPSAVIYLGHIPLEFQEDELRGFLSQFGPVSRLKLSRSPRTGRPRGYAFVEFRGEGGGAGRKGEVDAAGVAAAVAETMGGYLIGERRLVCHVLPRSRVHEKLFKGAKSIVAGVKSRSEKNRREVNGSSKKRGNTAEKITKGLMSRERKRRKKLEEAGIEDYGFEGVEERGVTAGVKEEESTPAPEDAKKTKKKRKTAENAAGEPKPEVEEKKKEPAETVDAKKSQK